MTVAVDQSFASSSTSNRLPQNQTNRLSKNTPFGRRNSIFSIPSDNHVSGSDSIINGPTENTANSSMDTDCSMDTDTSMDIDDIENTAPVSVTSKINQRRMTVAVDQSFASSSTSNHLSPTQTNRLSKITPFGRRISVHAVCDGNNRSIVNVNGGDEVQLVPQYSKDDNDISNVNDHAESSDNSNDFANSNVLMPKSIIDSPIPAIFNLQAPLMPSTTNVIGSSKVKTAKNMPSLIPIRECAPFQKEKATKKMTETAKFITNFLQDYDDKSQHTVSRGSINMNQDSFLCQDETFGRLYYSDSD